MINYSKLIPSWSEQVSKRKSHYSNLENISKFEGMTIRLHNATWCPDCQRESVELLAFLEANKSLNINFELISYEDKQLYKNQKLEKKLTVNCLPTMIFLSKGLEVLRIEEFANPSFKEVLIKFLAK